MSYRPFRNLAAALGTLAALAACAPEPPVYIVDNPPTEQAIYSIVGGDDVDFATAPASHRAVVGLHSASKFRGGVSVSRLPFCTGTVIDAERTVILTAGHCVMGSGGKLTRANAMMVQAGLATYVGQSDAVVAGAMNAVVQVSAHPGYSDRTLMNDIALVRLAAPIPVGNATTTWVAPQPSDQPLAAGDAVDFVGYGITAYGISDNNTLRHVDGTIAGPGCGYEPECGVNTQEIQDTQIWYEQVPDPADENTRWGIGPCSGDSGGPMFSHGNTYVSGVTSYGDARCDIYGVSTRVDAYVDNYIAAFVGGTGGEGEGEGPACDLGQKGDACSVDADCCSSTCRGGRNGKTCK